MYSCVPLRRKTGFLRLQGSFQPSPRIYKDHLKSSIKYFPLKVLLHVCPIQSTFTFCLKWLLSWGTINIVLDHIDSNSAVIISGIFREGKEQCWGWQFDMCMKLLCHRLALFSVRRKIFFKCIHVWRNLYANIKPLYALKINRRVQTLSIQNKVLL